MTLAALVMAIGTPPAWSQADTTVSPRPRPGAEFRIPLASVVVPGLGQYVHGKPALGVAFSATAALGYALYATGDYEALNATDLPRRPGGQQAVVGAAIAGTAGMLSAYEAFHSSLASFQGAGKYDFVTSHDSPASLLTAPFDLRMLRRWTTWIDLAYTGAVTVIVAVTETKPGRQYVPFVARDGLFTATLSYNAGVGEEALFRGWFYPVLYQNLGRRAELSNGLQAGVFGGLHAAQAGPFALMIAGWAFYEGWLTRRNGWSIRESVFHHFWYDVAVISATLLTQEEGTVTVVFPTVRF